MYLVKNVNNSLMNKADSYRLPCIVHNGNLYAMRAVQSAYMRDHGLVGK